MAISEPPGLATVESKALERMSREEGHVEEGLEPTPEEVADEALELDASPLRHTIAALLPAVAAAAMAGGIFNGVAPRVYAIAAAILGGLLGYAAQRIRSPILANGFVLVGLVAVGVLPALAFGGVDQVGHLPQLVAKSATQSRILRPPIDLTTGFTALLTWIMAAVGFAATWCAIVLKKPSIGVLLPLPVAGIAAISLPKDQQVVSGLILMLFFGISLAVLAGAREATGEQGLPVMYEVRRSLKAVPVLLVVTVGLYFLAQTNLLFPHPIIDPQMEAQRPRTTSLTDTPDRVIFEVQSDVTGPWVLGTLDVYDGVDWRLPPFAQHDQHNVPSNGVVDSSLPPGVKAVITIRDLGGAVLPTLPNTVGVEAVGPILGYDRRSGNIRLVEGQAESGFSYKVAAAAKPETTDLIKVSDPGGSKFKAFTQVPAPPSAVADLIAKAPKTSKWEEFDFLRNYVLENITATGTGSPVPIPRERVQQILAQSKEATPFELVAIQTLLARWVGVPARIGYGFDGGEKVGSHLEVHPRNGAAFPEVYFQGYGWLPVIGTPSKAKVSENSDPRLQQFTSGVLPSQDISVPLFMLGVVPPESQLVDQLRTGLLVAAIVVALVALLYFSFPILHKAVVRARRRARSNALGPRARIAQAYAEWRDLLTDYGYRRSSDTPLMLLGRFPDDDEHTELAWLVTRALWGDLQHILTAELAEDAEELTRTLRRRLGQAHPITVRMVAAASRLSLRSPYEVAAGREQERRAA